MVIQPSIIFDGVLIFIKWWICLCLPCPPLTVNQVWRRGSRVKATDNSTRPPPPPFKQQHSATMVSNKVSAASGSRCLTRRGGEVEAWVVDPYFTMTLAE
ncbi:hypothetical protein J6590_001970 [Homalodisca vitripennis]|nr:hypothetical protein J6590_001970 [Homalodisca vitripennis]